MLEEKNSLFKVKSFLNEGIFIIFSLAIFLLLLIPFASISFSKDETIIGNPQLLGFYEVLTKEVYIGDNLFNLSNSRIIFVFTIITIFISILTMCLGCYFKNKNKEMSFAFYCLTFIFSVGIMFSLLLSGFYVISLDHVSIDGISISSSTNTSFAICITICLLVTMLTSLLRLFDIKKYTIQEIAETGVLVALAVLLDHYCKIPIQANGGSINFSAIPLFIIAIRYGGFKGFVASSLLFGFITCLIDGYGFQTYPFDYFVALSGYGLVGTFYNFVNNYYEKRNIMLINSDLKVVNKKEAFIENLFKILAIIIAGVFVMIIRYFGHMVSGAILYQPITFIDNFIYQSTYVPLSVLISIVGMIVLYKPIELINRVFKVRNK